MNTLRACLGTFTKKIPFLHKVMVTIYHLIIFEVIPRFRYKKNNKQIKKSNSLEGFLSLQKIRVLKASNIEINTDKNLISYLKKNKIPFKEGGWTIYLPPSEKLKKIFPKLNIYPKDSGLKILRDLKAPEYASYTPDKLRPSPGAKFVRSRTPNPIELLRLAGRLKIQGLGNDVYDLVEVKFNSIRATAYIVEHVKGKKVSSEVTYKKFIIKLKKELEKGVIGISHGDYRMSKDFRSPDCNGNLLSNVNEDPIYIDFQSFYYQDELSAFNDWVSENSKNILFGPKRLGKGSDYLYQLIPGIGNAKRSTIERWEKIDNLIAKSHFSLQDKYTFDVGCNSGLMSYFALSRGAIWSYGWDQLNVAIASKKLLRLLGASRWTTIGGEINNKTNFKKSLGGRKIKNTQGVLFYLAISAHIGFPKAVSDLPWKYCIYEGHSNENKESTIKRIKKSGWDGGFKLLADDFIRDGDSPERYMVIFEREIK